MPTSRTTVSLIAPVAPFRGGIARHSEAIARAFARRGDVDLCVESFARLYPGWLYPGASDRDPARGGAPPVAVHADLDTLDPRTWARVADRVAARGGLAVIPAWTFFVAPALAFVARRLRARGVTVVTVVHNAADHSTRAWQAWFSRRQLRESDGFLVHSGHVARQLRESGLAQPLRCLAHPPFDDYPAPQGTLPRAHALELLCFGLVRHYKGVDIALRALALSGLADVRLTIAGEIWEDRREIEALIAGLGGGTRVELVDRYVSDAEAAELFARCDAVLAPYRAVTGSGVAALARHYRRPLVASRIEGLAEHIVDGETGWLFEAESEAALADLLGGSVTREAAARMETALGPAKRGAGWDLFAGALLDLAAAP